MRKTDSTLDPESLQDTLIRLGATPGRHQCVVAYSGGVDSHVLLHLLSRTEFNVSAVHVNHAISANANAWQAHCQQVCETLGIALVVEKISLAGSPGNTEARARHARYKALADHISADKKLLLTAHHQDDQAETVLLRLMRGSGVHGWAAMRATRPFARGQLIRPLLDISRRQILDYARAEDLSWIEDETNRLSGFDRNYLRHQVVPMLEARWPGVGRRLAQVAGDARDTGELLDQSISGHLALCQTADGELSVSALSRLAPGEQALTVRLWLRRRGYPMPSRHKLTEIISLLHQSTPHSVRWGEAEVWCYRDILAVRRSAPVIPGNWQLAWPDSTPELELPDLAIRLRLHETAAAGISSRLLVGATIELRQRRGGERVQLPGRQLHHQLKKVLQDAAVPPWLKNRLPLIFIDGQLAAVPGVAVFEPFCCRQGEPGKVFEITETNKNGDWVNLVV
ncbi:MAG: tRNA lysidine(34) synthetase TilS [Gammaproteobacteria bacterium]|nr:tRNA lysidine(34) synthetase TilS [Gammaproteobacteria bacterium]